METLLEAILLVFLIMWLFMGSIRATLIPTIAVPIVILGTFAVLQFFGFSINMLTMFAMVLSIGLLVDDAIVVVENVERIMSEEGLPPKEATAKSMTQITSALDRHRACSLSRFRTDGILWRLDGRHLQAILGYDHSLNALIRHRRPRAHTRSVRHYPETGAKRA